ncbi:MAG: hemerythrin domain-containing protein [Gammaproteobacteria bacterium]|nr:hemerythrin domain-containing protein [Gammaproteobacteria bacterium]
MSGIMDQLKADHANVAELLDILEEQLDIVEREGDADFDLMHDVMLYMTRYPDWHHHPMEDLVFERMRARDAESVDVVDRLTREHMALKDKGAILLDLLASVVDGALVERDELSARGRDYALFLRKHMELEDSEAFPRAEAALRSEDWNGVASAMQHRDDPVFGAVLDEEFRSLFDYIERERR